MRQVRAYEPLPTEADLFVNVKSRNGADWFPQINNRLEEGGLTLRDARRCRGAKELMQAVSRSLAQGSPMILVGGGDGTFSAVAHMFARRPTVLGVLPLGTGNAFARDLEIADTLDGACDTILQGKVASVDMGLIENREFVNLATVGLSTEIAKGLNDRTKRRFGKTVYLASLLRALATVEPFRVRMEMPGVSDEFESLQVVIGNGMFHAGPFPLAPDASITGGWLSIYALASHRKSACLTLALHMALGGKLNLSEIKVYRAKSGRLITDPPQRVTVDGEICLNTPVEFGIAPNALRVAVPAKFEG